LATPNRLRLSAGAALYEAHQLVAVNIVDRTLAPLRDENAGLAIFVRYILKQSAITLDILMSDEFVDGFMGQHGHSR